MSVKKGKSKPEDKDSIIDDTDSSSESVSSGSSWKIEPDAGKTHNCSSKVINISDSSSDCSDETYEAKVLSYLSGISINENVKSEEMSFKEQCKEVENENSSSWESDSSFQPSFHYRSRTLVKKRIWETLEKSMEEDNKVRRAKKLRKKRKLKLSPEKVCNKDFVEAGEKRNEILAQIQAAHLEKRAHTMSSQGHVILNDPNQDPTLFNVWFCEICNENFETKLLLNSHMVNVHEGLVKFICQNCGYAFFNAQSYNEHYHVAHIGNPSVVSCCLCGSSGFPNFASLLDHLKTSHVTQDLFGVRCQHCSAVLLNREVLDRHRYLKLCHKNLIPLFLNKIGKGKDKRRRVSSNRNLNSSSLSEYDRRGGENNRALNVPENDECREENLNRELHSNSVSDSIKNSGGNIDKEPNLDRVFECDLSREENINRERQSTCVPYYEQSVGEIIIRELDLNNVDEFRENGAEKNQNREPDLINVGELGQSVRENSKREVDLNNVHEFDQNRAEKNQNREVELVNVDERGHSVRESNSREVNLSEVDEFGQNRVEKNQNRELNLNNVDEFGQNRAEKNHNRELNLSNVGEFGQNRTEKNQNREVELSNADEFCQNRAEKNQNRELNLNNVDEFGQNIKESNKRELNFNNIDESSQIATIHNRELHLNNVGEFCDNKGEDNKRSLHSNSVLRNDQKNSKQFRRLNGVYECEECESVFKRSKYLRQHLALHHQASDVFKCYVCSRRFGARYKLEEHFRYDHSGLELRCEQCEKVFKNKFTLSTHMKKHRELLDRFACVFCGEKFKRKQSILDHMSDMCRKCLWCGVFAECRSKLLEHIDNNHRSHGRLECTECRRNVYCLTKFWNHLIVYHPEQCRLVNKNCVTCEKCRQLCSSRHHLKKHQRKLCLVSEKNVCNHCNIRFSTNYLHVVHWKPNLRCSMCGESFRCLTLLKEHVYYSHKVNRGQLNVSECNSRKFVVIKSVSRRNSDDSSLKNVDSKADSLNESTETVENLKSCVQKCVESTKLVETVRGKLVVESKEEKFVRQGKYEECLDKKLVESTENVSQLRIVSNFKTCDSKFVESTRNGSELINSSKIKLENAKLATKPFLKCRGSIINLPDSNIGICDESLYSSVPENVVTSLSQCAESKNNVVSPKGGSYCDEISSVFSKNVDSQNDSKIVKHCDENSNESVSNNVEIVSEFGKSSKSCKESFPILPSTNVVEFFEPNNVSLASKNGEFKNFDPVVKSSRIFEESFPISSTTNPEEYFESVAGSIYDEDGNCDSRNLDNISDSLVDTSQNTTLYQFRCYICFGYYQTLRDLECHQRLAHDYDVIPAHFSFCNYCEKQFSKRSILKGHFRRCRCSICGAKFQCWSLLRFHCTSKHRNGEWCCDICSRTFRTSLTLVKHARNCFGNYVKSCRKRKRTRRKIVNNKFVNHPKYKRIRMLNYSDDEYCNGNKESTGRSNLKPTNTFRIVLKTPPRKKNTSSVLRKTLQECVKLSPRKNLLDDEDNDVSRPLSKNQRRSQELTPEKNHCKGGNVVESLINNYEFSPEDVKIWDGILKPGTDGKTLMIGDEKLKPERKLVDLSPENFKDLNVVLKPRKRVNGSSVVKCSIIGDVDLKPSKSSLEVVELNRIRKLSNLSPIGNDNMKSVVLDNSLDVDDLKPLRKCDTSQKHTIVNHEIALETSWDTSKDLIIDTSASYCQDNNDTSLKTHQDESLTDFFQVTKNTDKDLSEVTRTDFFLNLDLVSSTPISNVHRKKLDPFSDKRGPDSNVEDNNKVCRQLVMGGGGNLDSSSIVSGETSPQNMPPSILKTVSSVSASKSCKRVVHFEDDEEINSVRKCSNRLSYEADPESSRSFLEMFSNHESRSSSVAQSTQQSSANTIPSSNKAQIFRCRLCKKRFPSKCLLQNHISSNVCMVKIPNLS